MTTAALNSLVPNVSPQPTSRQPSKETVSTAGPFLHFHGQDLVDKVWNVSMMTVLETTSATPKLPKVTLSTSPNKELEAKVVAVARDNFFVRYDLSVPQTEKEQKVTYTVDDKAYTFHVPGLNQSTRMGYYSCNGYQRDEDKASIGGIQPMWAKVKEDHAKKPFHLMIGGGDQLYSDGLVAKAQEPRSGGIRGVFALPTLQKWLSIEDKEKRNNHPLTPEMIDEVAEFYLEHYLRQYSEAEFRDVLATVPSAMSWDDHDIFDGWGSYPPELQQSSVFQGIFALALQHYLLFQHQATADEAMEGTSLFGKEGFTFLHNVDNGKVAILGVDTRTERTQNQVVAPETWDMIFERLKTLPDNCKHLLVMLSVPLIYPSLDILDKTLENANKSSVTKWMLSNLPGFKNQFGLWELADDGRDHWGHEAHAEERNTLVHKFQQLAKERNVRVTLLGGDVHIGGAGKIYDPTDKTKIDSQTMWQVISSPIGNVPAPSMVMTVLKGLSRDSKPFDGKNAMKLVGMKNMADPSDLESFFANRNYAIMQHDPLASKFDVRLKVERDSKDPEGRNHHDTFQLRIPDVRPGGWRKNEPTTCDWFASFFGGEAPTTSIT